MEKALAPGTILKGKYKIIKKIGEGGMSKVWLAEDTLLQKNWAIKEIDKHSNEYKEVVNKDGSMTEVEILRGLDHPFAPRVTDIYENEDTICVVMDYIEGESLQKILLKKGPQKQEVVVSWIIDVCKLIYHLHSKHIIYRDMNPNNIMLTSDGTIKVIDFGIAKIVKDNNYIDYRAWGTRGYASPEHKAKCTNEQSDIYTIGVTLYTLLTGQIPPKTGFVYMPLKKFNPELSSGLEEIILKCTREDSKDRYQNVASLIDALNNYKKIEKPYMDKLRRKIKTAKALLATSVTLIILGLLGFEGGMLKDTADYRNLVNASALQQSEEILNYKDAMEVIPYKAEAYQKLLECYKDNGLTENEFTELDSLYNEKYEPSVIFKNTAQRAELNYKIGEAIISNYKELDIDDAKGRLLLAKPYFERAKDIKSDYKTVATGYYNLAVFEDLYEDKNEISSDVGASVYQSMNSIVINQDAYFGKGSERNSLATYEIILEILRTSGKTICRSGVNGSSIVKLVSDIELKYENISAPSNVSDKILYTEVGELLPIVQDMASEW